MKRAHFLAITAFMFAVLLPSAVGCGEIDLPQPDESGQGGNGPGGAENGGSGSADDNDEKPAHPGDSGNGSGDTGNGSGDTGNGSNDTGNGSNDSGNGSSDTGNGSSDTGNGSNDSGNGSGDTGNGSGDSGNDPANPGSGLSGSTPAGQHAVITAEGHILIDGHLYISAKEWRDVPGGEKSALANAGTYTEGELTGWRVPTADDVDLLLSIYQSESFWYGKTDLSALNHVLDASGLEPIYIDAHYLYDRGCSYFTLDINAAKSTDAASTKKKYRLRLVRDK